MAAMWSPVIKDVCHGNWGINGQNLQCSFKDLLFETRYIAQVIDWQNAVFLLFMPLMLWMASMSFRLTFKALGANDLDNTIRNAGDIKHGSELHVPDHQPLQRTQQPVQQQNSITLHYLPQVYPVGAQHMPHSVEAPLHMSGHLQPVEFVPLPASQMLQFQHGISSPGTYSEAPVHPIMMHGMAFGTHEIQDGQYMAQNLQPYTLGSGPLPQMQSAGPQLEYVIAPHSQPIQGPQAILFRNGRQTGANFVLPTMTVQPKIMKARSMEHSNLVGDVDRRNIAVMVSMAGFIFSIGFICWASISQFVDPASPTAMYAQGWATQVLKQGQEQRAKNLGWGLCWLLIGTCYMTLVSLVIRTVVIGRHLNLVDFIAVKGSIAVAIFEASLQLSIGMVAGAAIAGPPSPEGFIWDLAGFFLFSALSFVLLIMFNFLFDIYAHDWSTWGELKKGNEAAAISSGVQIVCSAMLMSNAVSKSFELVTFFGWFVTGTLLRLFFRSLLDYAVVAPRWLGAQYTADQLKIDRLIKKNNWGTAVVIGSLQILVTKIINTCLPSLCSEFMYLDGRSASEMSFREKLIATEYIFTAWQYDRLIAIGIIFAVFLVSRPLFELRLWLHVSNDKSGPPASSNLNYYIYENKLNAVNLSFGAYLVSVGNCLCGVFRDANYGDTFAALDDPAAWGLLLLQILAGNVMVLVALMINDLFMLHKFNNMREMVRNNNIAVALIEVGSLIGSSFIIEGAINGWDYSDPPYVSAVIMFLASQLFLFLFLLVFEAVTVYDDEQEIAIGNAAAGLFTGLSLMAAGLLLGRSVYLSHSIITLSGWALISFPLLFVMHRVVDRIVFPRFRFEATIECLDRRNPNMNRPIRASKQGNWGVALVAGIIGIAFANLLNTFLHDCVYVNGIPSLVRSA